MAPPASGPELARADPASPAHPSAHGPSPGHPTRRPTRARVADLLALAALALVAAILHRDLPLAGRIPFESDTPLFYYPMMAFAAERLRAGEFPLWNPLIFGGYPVFSDGEAGLLYPFNLALPWLGASQGFALLRPLHTLLAAAFAYAYGRSIGLGALGALTVGLVFALGAFLTAQLHHTNVVASAVWLPAILACVELALRPAPGERGRLAGVSPGWALLGAVAYALMWFGVHVQPAIMATLLLVPYAGWRALVPLDRSDDTPPGLPGGNAGGRSTDNRTVRGRLAAAAVVLGVVIGLGAALAAVQILPLWELGSASRRGEPQDPAFGGTYSTPIYNLITLLLPDFFRGGPAGWALWPAWEIALYVGIVPLALAPLAWLDRTRRRALALPWTLVALASLILAFGRYIPLPLHEWLWQLPPFAYLRAPGRFSFLFTLALAALAGLGCHWLAAAAPARQPGARRRLALVVGGLGLTGVVVAAALLLTRRWLAAHREAALDLIREHYLALPHAPTVPPAEAVYVLLRDALAPSAPGTLLAAGFGAAALTLLALVLWRPALRRVAAVALVGLLALDLLRFAHDFHPQMALTALDNPAPAARFLAAAGADGRAFAFPGTQVEPNRLIGVGVPEIGGYSSLQSARSIGYTSYLLAADSPLLDLAGVRWVAVPAAEPPRLQHAGTRFDVARPLYNGTPGNPTERTAFRLDPAAPATELRLVSRLRYGASATQGSVVGTLTVTDVAGQTWQWPIRAGIETAEWAWERPDVRAVGAHDRPPVAFTWQSDNREDGRFTAHLYDARFALDRPARIARVELAALAPGVQLQVNGLSLYDAATGSQRSLGRFDAERYTLAWSDEATRVWENRQRLPRAFLVDEAVAVDSADQQDLRRRVDLLNLIAEGPFDVARRAIILDGPPDLPRPVDGVVPPAAGSAASGEGEVTVEAVRPEWLRLRVEVPEARWLVVADAYDPGWAATVDGVPTPVYRADALFRAVRVPAGAHVVEMRFVPAGLPAGLAISCAALAGLGAAALATRWRSRGRGGS